MRPDKIYLDHINEAIEKILTYTKGMNKQKFEQSGMAQDAVIRNIEIIGEATKKISNDLKSNYFGIHRAEQN